MIKEEREMSQKGLETQRNYPLHKKVREFFWGGWCMQTNWNYERQMNTAFMWGISKTLDRLYPDPKDEEKKNKRKSSENFSSREDATKLRKTLRGTRGNERKKVGKEISMRSKSEDRTRNVKKKSQHPSR